MYANQTSKYTFDHPQVFERVHQARFGPECDFLLSILSSHPGFSHVLDAACGTGAHAALLAQAGFSVTGIDLNTNMIHYARRKHAPLAFLVGDMRALPFSNAFDAIICLCTSFCYNTTNDEIAAALQGFRRALRSGGLAIIDVFNPISLLEQRSFREEIREEEKFAQMGMVSVSEITVEERSQLLVEKRTLYSLKDDKPIQTDLTKYRLFFPQELRYFLETNGFEDTELYGGFDLNQKDLEGSRLIAVSRKR